MATVPPGFIDLNALRGKPETRGTINVIGMVIDVLPPSNVGTGNIQMTFSITDLSSYQTTAGARGFRVKFFVNPAMANDLPKLNQHGDILMLKNADLKIWSGIEHIMNDRRLTEWQVIPYDSIPKPNFAVAVMGGKQRLQSIKSRNVKATESITLPEQSYIIDLAHAYSKMSSLFSNSFGGGTNASYHTQAAQSNYPPPIRVIAERHPLPGGHMYGSYHPQALQSDHLPPTRVIAEQYQVPGSAFRPPASKRFRLIQDVKDREYVDLFVEVVKIYDKSQETELYVTDYTENTLMYKFVDPQEQGNGARDGDEYGYTSGLTQAIPGPWGHRVLRVIAKQPHGEWARQKVTPGQFLRLTNVKISYDRNNILDGTLWQDRSFPDKILIAIVYNVRQPEIQDIIKRKEEYYAARVPVAALLDAAEETAIETEKLSKSAAKKKKKREKKEKQEAEAQAALLAAHNEATRPNPQIKCTHRDTPLSLVSTVRDKDDKRHTCTLGGRTCVVPFVNANFRVKVRVLDFKPDQLEDFAVLLDDGRDQDSMDLSLESSQRWKWSFTLIVEDAMKPDPQALDRVILHIGHQEAQFLLGNDIPDPGNLKEDPALLSKLREKLFHLWGDLEEQKVAGSDLAPVNRPFECCVAEYGRLREGGQADNMLDWDQEFRLHGVTIA